MRAVLDACVLYPTVMRALLLVAADAGAFVPLWSPRITEEWVRAAGKSGDTKALEIARAEAALLDARYPKASVAIPDDAIEVILPDPGDDHVLGLARHAKAQAIITLNHKDFPTRTLARFDLLRIDPDALMLDAYSESPEPIMGAVQTIRAEIAAATGEPVQLRAFLKLSLIHI